MRVVLVVVLALALAGCSAIREMGQTMRDRFDDPYDPTGIRSYVFKENSIEVWRRGSVIMGVREVHEGIPYEWGKVGEGESTYHVVDDWSPENWRWARWDSGLDTSLCVYSATGHELCPPQD